MWLEDICFCMDYVYSGSVSVSHCGLAEEAAVRDHGSVLIMLRFFLDLTSDLNI